MKKNNMPEWKKIKLAVNKKLSKLSATEVQDWLKQQSVQFKERMGLKLKIHQKKIA
ncbi:MAG: hypothetical protein WCG27_06930 [Pseudomonadota bacterium]